MALTLEKQIRLDSAGVTAYFNTNRPAWKTAAKRAYDYIKTGFAGQPVRIDDVVEPLVSVVEIDKSYRDLRNKKKLTQKYWIADFAEYVLDQVWDEIT